jgi:chromosome segregation ATPase
MALSSSAQSTHGRRPHAGRSALTGIASDGSASVPRIPATATALPKSQTSDDSKGRIHLLTNRDSMALNVAALQQQVAERAAATRLLTRQVETLTNQASVAAEKIAELDRELAWAQEERAHHDNEVHSLQKSVELTTAENARLTKRLADCEGAVGKAYVQLERMKAALIATERERSKSASAVDRADQKWRSETASLNARLETMTSCAATADTLLAGLRRNLQEKLELLQNLLAIKERQLDELKQSRSKLLERTAKLLEAFKAREAMLAAAEERNQALADRIAEAEAAAAKQRQSLSARLAQAEAALKRNEEELNSTRFELQDERKKRRAAEFAKKQAVQNQAAHNEAVQTLANAYRAAIQRETDNGATKSGFCLPPGVRPADMLLAGTISL